MNVSGNSVPSDRLKIRDFTRATVIEVSEDSFLLNSGGRTLQVEREDECKPTWRVREGGVLFSPGVEQKYWVPVVLGSTVGIHQNEDGNFSWFRDDSLELFHAKWAADMVRFGELRPKKRSSGVIVAEGKEYLFWRRGLCGAYSDFGQRTWLVRISRRRTDNIPLPRYGSPVAFVLPPLNSTSNSIRMWMPR